MNPVYDLDILQDDSQLFVKTKEELKNHISRYFSSRQGKCTIILNKKEYSTTQKFALINLILLKFYVDSNIKIEEEDLYFETIINSKIISEYTNRCLDRFTQNNNDYEFFKTNLQLMLDDLVSCVNFNKKLGVNFSLFDFVKLIATNQRFKKIVRPTIPKNLKFDEVEKLANNLADELMEVIVEDKSISLYDYGITKTGINKNQFRQLACFVGLKPDMYNGIFHKVVTDNYLYGMSTKEFYYMNCVGTRKAQCINYNNVRKSGYTTRTLDLAAVDRFHDPDFHDCGTKHLSKITIKSEKQLKMFSGRHYKLIDEDSGAFLPELYTIDLKTKDSKNLIGKTIALRTPVTCAGKTSVCTTCYGRELAEKNRYLHTGINANKNLMEPIMQYLLSAKHFLSTNSKKIDFSEEFMECFEINLDTIAFKSSADYSISFEKPSPEDIDEDTDLFIIRKITLNDLENKTSTEYDLPIDLLLNPEIKCNKDIITIKSEEFDDYVFKYFVQNHELNKSLNDIIGLFESSNHLDIDNYEELLEKFCELAIDNNLGNIQAIHAEMLLSVLIIDPKTLKRVDFSKTKKPNYKISRASTTILNGPITKSLSYERISQQLGDLRTYQKRESSYLDHLYK